MKVIVVGGTGSQVSVVSARGADEIEVIRVPDIHSLVSTGDAAMANVVEEAALEAKKKNKDKKPK